MNSILSSRRIPSALATFAFSVLAAQAQNATAPFFNVADPTDSYVNAQAQALGNDPTQIFAFVRDQVALQAYPGSVRGARGTLWNMAGNSLDKSSLLVALLRAAGYQARYAQGTLNDTSTLYNLVVPNPPQLLGCTTGGGNSQDYSSDLQTHFWVQYGSSNTDLDASFPGSTPGQTHTTVDQTFTDVPQQYRQTITVKENVEIYSQAFQLFQLGPSTNPVLTQTFESAALVGHPISFTHEVAGSAQSPLVFSFTTFTYTPLLIVGQGNGTVASDTVIKGQAFQEHYTNYPLGTTIVTGVFLEVDYTDLTTGTPQTYTHTVYDRLGFAARNSGQVTVQVPSNPVAIISPIDSTTINALPGTQAKASFQGEATRVQDAQSQLNAIQAQVQALPSAGSYSAAQTALILQAQVLERNLFVAANEIVASGFNYAADQLEHNMAGAYVTSIYYASPRLTIASAIVDASNNVIEKLDLLKRDVRLVTNNANSSRSNFELNVQRGLAESSMEAATIKEVTGQTAADVSTVFAALTAPGSVVAISPSNATDVEQLSLPADATARISSSVANGDVVFAPLQPPTVNGQQTTIWLDFNPQTGDMISVGVDGGHQGLAEFPAALEFSQEFNTVIIEGVGRIAGIGLDCDLFAVSVFNAISSPSINNILAAGKAPVSSAGGNAGTVNTIFEATKRFDDSVKRLKEILKTIAKPTPTAGLLGTAVLGLLSGLEDGEKIFDAVLGKDPEVPSILVGTVPGIPAPITPGTTPGVNVSVTPDTLFTTTPFQGVDIPLVYRVNVQNTGPVTDTFTISANSGLSNATVPNELTVPAGQTGQVNVCLAPLYYAAPGAISGLNITAQSETNSNVSSTVVQGYTVPSLPTLQIAFVQQAIVLPPNVPVKAVLNLSGTGNASPGAVSLAITAVPGVTVTGLTSPATVGAGQVTTEQLTFTAGTSAIANASYPVTVTATYSNGQTATADVLVQIAGASTCALNAAQSALTVNIPSFANTLTALGQAMNELSATPTSAQLLNRVQTTIATLVQELNGSFLAQYQAQLQSASAAFTNAQSVPTALNTLSSVLCSLNTTVGQASNGSFTSFLSPNQVVMFPSQGQTAFVVINVYNNSPVARSFSFAVNNMPAGVTWSLLAPSIVVPAGQQAQTTLNITAGANVLASTGYSVTVTPQDSPSQATTINGSVEIRKQFVVIDNAAATPAYLSAGTPITFSVRVFDSVNSTQQISLGAQVYDPKGNGVFTNIFAAANLSSGSALQTVTFPRTFDTTGLTPGVYKLVISYASLTAQTTFVVGQPIGGSLTATPSVLAPPTGTTLTTLTLRRDLTQNTVSNLVGLAPFSTHPGNVVFSGNIGYVCQPSGITIVDFTNPASPVEKNTFGQSDLTNNPTSANCTIMGSTLVVGFTVNNGSQPLHLISYNISTPLSPTLVGQETDINRVIGDGVFIVQGNIGFGRTNEFVYDPFSGGFQNQFGDLIAVNFANPGHPVFVSDLFPSGDATRGGPNLFFGIASPATGLLYVATTTSAGTDPTSGAGQLDVVDISNPSQMKIIATVPVPNVRLLVSLAINGTTLIATGDTKGFTSGYSGFTGNLALTSFDITNPRAPVLKQTLVTQYVQGSSVVSMGNGTFVVGGSSVSGNPLQPVLLAVDATTPTNLQYMETHVDTSTDVVTVRGTNIYAVSNDGVPIFQLAKQNGPSIVAQVQVPNSSNVTVNPASFSLQPSKITPGTSSTTYEWDQPAVNTITWNTTVTNLQPGQETPIVSGGSIQFTQPGAVGDETVTLDQLQVLADQIISINPLFSQTTPGTPVAFTLTFKNPTSAAITYTPTPTGLPASWVSGLKAVSVPANSSVTQTLTLTPGLGTTPGSFYQFTVGLAGGGISGVVNSSLQVNALSAGGSPTVVPDSPNDATVTLQPSTISIGRGGTKTVAITIVNTGSQPNFINPNVGTGNGVTVTPPLGLFQTISPGLGNSFTFVAQVSADPTAPLGLQTIPLALTFGNSGLSVNIPVTVLPQGVTLTATPASGTTATVFSIQVKNTGSAADTFNFGASGPLGASTQLSKTSLPLAAGATGTFTVSFGSLPPVVAGANSFTITATSAANTAANANVTLPVTVPSIVAVSATLAPTTAQVTAIPGSQQLVFSLLNTGTLDDNYIVSVGATTGPVTASLTASNGTPVASVGPLYVSAASAGQLIVTANMSAAGSGTVTVNVVSRTNSSIKAFATATITSSTTTVTSPVATALATANVPIGRSTVLDGTGSHDTNSPALPLTYAWTVTQKPTGSAITNASIRFASNARAAFVPDVAGAYSFNLVVNNGKKTASAVVSLTAGFLPPVAVPGKPQNSKIGSPVFLNGKDSYDPQALPLTFVWGVTSVPTGSTVTTAALHNNNTPAPFFQPDVAGVYKLSLVVNDGTAASAVAYLLVTATAGNVPPNANAGYPQSTATGRSIKLDGTLSNNAGQGSAVLSYAWTFTQLPTGSTLSNTSISSATTATPTFTPDVAGTYQLKLTVSDTGGTATDTVYVYAYSGFSPPNAITQYQIYDLPAIVAAVSGASSFDPDSAPATISYLWSFVTKPTASKAALSSTTSSAPSLVPDVAGYYVLRLDVSDGVDTNFRNVLVQASNSCDVDASGVINQLDLSLIQAAQGTAATFDDPRDYNHDGQITAADYTGCSSHLTQYQLTIATNGTGTGTVQPGSGLEPVGVPVTLTPVPDACSLFGQFSSNVVNNTIILNGPTTVTATFNSNRATQVGLLPTGGTASGQVTLKATANRRVTNTNNWLRTYSVTNTGAALKNVVLALDPPLTNIVALSSSLGTTLCSTPNGSWYVQLPDLPANGVTTITIQVTTQAPLSPWNATVRVLAGGKP